MKQLFIILSFLTICFPSYSQFRGGTGGGSDKAEIRTRTILSIENEQEKAFFEQIKISSQSNSFLVEWTDKVSLKQIEIIDILGRVQKTISISEFQKAVSIDFEGKNNAKGIYFVRFKDKEGRFFSKKVVY
jgi:hypothetical protein